MVGVMTNEAAELTALRRSRQDFVSRGGNKSQQPMIEPNAS